MFYWQQFRYYRSKVKYFIYNAYRHYTSRKEATLQEVVDTFVSLFRIRRSPLEYWDCFGNVPIDRFRLQIRQTFVYYFYSEASNVFANLENCFVLKKMIRCYCEAFLKYLKCYGTKELKVIDSIVQMNVLYVNIQKPIDLVAHYILL